MRAGKNINATANTNIYCAPGEASIKKWQRLRTGYLNRALRHVIQNRRLAQRLVDRLNVLTIMMGKETAGRQTQDCLWVSVTDVKR